MSFERNVGGVDRLARGVLVTTLAGRPTLAIGAALASLGLLFNAAVGFCGVNALLGIDTCSRE